MTGWDAVAEFQAWCDSEGIEIGDDALETWRYENGVTLSALALRRIDKLIERTTREEIMSSKLPVGAAVRVLGTTLTGVVTRSKAIHDVRLDDYSPAGDMTDTERSQCYHRSELVAATAGESLRYPWSTDAYRRYTSIDIVQVDHA
jgi:hypothetical protein